MCELGGSLITTRHILSNARCMDKSLYVFNDQKFVYFVIEIGKLKNSSIFSGISLDWENSIVKRYWMGNMLVLILFAMNYMKNGMPTL